MSSRDFDIVASIRNGFPVRLLGTFGQDEEGFYIDSIEVLTTTGRSTSFLKLTPAEEETLTQTAANQLL